jgi:hypothetical protein
MVDDSTPPKGYARGIKTVQFRVTDAQRRELEVEAERRGLTANEVARRRCFPEKARPLDRPKGNDDD